jgi:signal transduction histidine kinase
MRSSLIFKLMGAFLLVIALGAVVITILTNQATRSAFSIYTTRNGQAWAQSLAPELADYYTTHGSWQGVDTLLENSSIPSMGMMGSGNGPGRGMGFGRQNSTGNPMMDLRFILADAQGAIIYDTDQRLTGKSLLRDQLKVGTPIQAQGQLLGTIIVSPGTVIASNSPEGQFLESVNRSIIWSTVVAGIVALVAGALLFLQIIAPLRSLRNAANAIAAGDLSQRVAIQSNDELGDVGYSFNQMAENLARAENQRRQMIADVAHELRTPLAVMQANIEGMLDGVLPLENAQVETLHEQALLLNRMVGDLRLLSLAEAGELHLELQETDSGSFLAKTADSVRAAVESKQIQLVTNIQPGLPTVHIDADRIHQVISNLVGNAVRYTPAGGIITITACNIPPESTTPAGVEISVTDTGSGISAEDLPYVFDRFYRADKSRARASGGSGLGLAIARQLVEAHDGRIYAESPVFKDAQEQNPGTRIRFFIPITE